MKPGLAWGGGRLWPSQWNGPWKDWDKLGKLFQDAAGSAWKGRDVEGTDISSAFELVCEQWRVLSVNAGTHKSLPFFTATSGEAKRVVSFEWCTVRAWGFLAAFELGCGWSREEGQKGRMCVTNSLSLQHLFTLEGQRRCGSISTELNPWVIVGAFFQDLVVLSLEDKWASSLGCESGFPNSWALIAASLNARPRATPLCEEAQELPKAGLGSWISGKTWVTGSEPLWLFCFSELIYLQLSGASHSRELFDVK